MMSFSIYGCDAADVNTLECDDFFDTALTDELYGIEDKAELFRVKGLLMNRAKRLNIAEEFTQYCTRIENTIDDYNETEDFNKVTDFGVPGFEHLNCGKWIADIKGIRKKSSKVFASLIPIQPVEILENISSGTEKVKLKFYKNGRTRTIIADRTVIAAKSRIVNLAAQGIEVTSENAGQLVSYLSDVINSNDLPVSTACSQLGWCEELFLPYDSDIVFDGEENNRFLFNAFTSRGSFKTWRDSTERYRENIYVRLAMDAAFASVLLEKISALPFVFHLWGKSGTGKTVALMIAMSVWGNPALGATVRTLNMTQNAMIAQAAFLNSLPFAGDELQTIKERSENYDKLIMRCTEGIDRGRMIDGQKAAETKRWKCAFLFTGEDKCTRTNSGAGVKNRCIEAEVATPLFNGVDGNAAVQIVEKNYGHAGRKFIRALQEADLEQLRADYNKLTLSLAEQAGTEPKQAASMAVLMLADEIAGKLFYKHEKPLCFEDVRPYIARSDEIDVTERAYSYILDIIAKNHYKFNPDDEGYRGELWGTYSKGALYFNSTVLKAELAKEGFDFNSMAQAWAKNGYIRKAKDGRNTVKTTVNGIKARYVVIELPDDLEEDDTDYEAIEI